MLIQEILRNRQTVAGVRRSLELSLLEATKPKLAPNAFDPVNTNHYAVFQQILL
jgi:hypothetical protein